jgi:outer membrane lipoprotein-sorting protein
VTHTDLHALIGNAARRYRTLRATIWRSLNAESGPMVGTIERLWLELPDRIRSERDSPSGHDPETFICLTDGTHFWTYTRGYGATVRTQRYVDEHGPWSALFDPGRLVDRLDLESRGEQVRRGRTVLRVRANRKTGTDPHDWDEDLLDLGAWGVNAYDLIVDSERGVILQADAVVGDTVMGQIDVQEIAFDEAFPPETFTLTPPAGERLVSLDTYGSAPE